MECFHFDIHCRIFSGVTGLVGSTDTHPYVYDMFVVLYGKIWKSS
jgi:hypothetical protein